MNRDHLDIGIIQAFLDGELATGEVSRVSDHIGDCDNCALLLAQAEDENAVVFPSLAREFDTMVPTQRLWARINDSIESQKAAEPWYGKLYGILLSGFASPSFAMAAGLLIIAGIFGVFMLKRPAAVNEIATGPTTRVTMPAAEPAATTAAVKGDQVVSTDAFRPTVERASLRETRRDTVQPAVYRPSQPAATAVDASYMPGEESYVKTISSLSKTADASEDPDVLRPSQRISYERDMAVVNDTINRMRAALKKNPKNETAKQVLYSSYQNKIDLLSSVAQKEELVVSMR
jgi:anti-sigma factor RsiW